MNVNCKVSLTDEQRNTMFRNLNGGDSKKMVSRADVNAFVQKKIEECLNGLHLDRRTKTSEEATKEVRNGFEATREGEFKPSRGDEPYIFKAKDESLRAIHSRMLDCIEEYEKAVWAEMEKNRR